MISGQTCLVGLLGQPVDHSLSPVIQNAALKEMGLDWCYLAMPCKAEDLKMVTKALRNLNCKGLNITIPHKQQAVDICDHVSSIAKNLGAINTLIPNQEGGWNGANTDVEGFLAPLKTKHWGGKKVIVIGNGGSARAVMAGLHGLKLDEITVIGRSQNNLNRFINNLSKKIFKSEDNTLSLQGLLQSNPEVIEKITQANLIINTTPIGMSAKGYVSVENDAIPLGKDIWKHLKTKTVLYDLIYTPRPTPWLKLGIENGFEIIDGLEMLIQQGAASLKLWTQEDEIPINTMKKAAKKHLEN